MGNKGGIPRKKNGMPKTKGGCRGLVSLILLSGPILIGVVALVKII